MSKPVILTGLRANSEFHLGNYLGALLPMSELITNKASDYDVNLMVADLHSLTTPIEYDELQKQILQNLKIYVAAGVPLDHDNIHIFRQSYVSAHSELSWIVECFTYFGEASRMVEFKEKAEQQENASVGLLNYPDLMAADILLYHTSWVPLGADQQQHLELTRNVAIRMNNKFGELFTVPESWKKQLEFTNRQNIRIRSLRNPDKKMSKSIDDPAGTIMLSDKPADAAKKVLGATTDSANSIKLDWEKQPGVSNLLQILALLSNKPLDEVVKECEGKTNYAHLKQHVADHVKDFLTDFQAKLAKVDEKQLITKLEQDEKAMKEVANKTLLKVQKAVGLRPT